MPGRIVFVCGFAVKPESKRLPDAYERLILDVMNSDKRNFVRTGESLDKISDWWRGSPDKEPVDLTQSLDMQLATVACQCVPHGCMVNSLRPVLSSDAVERSVRPLPV